MAYWLGNYGHLCFGALTKSPRINNLITTLSFFDTKGLHWMHSLITDNHLCTDTTDGWSNRRHSSHNPNPINLFWALCKRSAPKAGSSLDAAIMLITSASPIRKLVTNTLGTGTALDLDDSFSSTSSGQCSCCCFRGRNITTTRLCWLFPIRYNKWYRWLPRRRHCA